MVLYYGVCIDTYQVLDSYQPMTLNLRWTLTLVTWVIMECILCNRNLRNFSMITQSLFKIEKLSIFRKKLSGFYAREFWVEFYTDFLPAYSCPYLNLPYSTPTQLLVMFTIINMFVPTKLALSEYCYFWRRH